MGLAWAAAAAAILSGFFSLNGYALRGVGRRELEAALAGAPPRRLESLLAHLRDLQMLCALLRTLCNLALLVIMLYLFDAAPHDILGIVYALLSSAAIIAICGVAIPNAWARYAGARVVRVSAGALLTLRWVFWPAVTVMRAFDLPIRRLSGVPDATEDSPAAEDEQAKAEIMQVASDAAAEGAVEPEEVDMIESVMELGDRAAGEIMTPRTDIVALPAEATAEEVRQNIVTNGHTRIPIYDGDIDNIIGILHAKDLLANDNLQHLELRKIIRKPFFVPESKKLDELLKEFKARQMHMSVVLDEYGGTAGLVTIEDLLEEIVGNIGDEYDSGESPLMKRIDERTVEVDGRMRIDELNGALHLHLPETDDYDTAAGLVFSELGFIPSAGEMLTTHGVTFTVLAADARKISRLKVEVPKEGQAEEIDH